MNYIDPRFDSVCKTEETGKHWGGWLQSDSGDEQPYVAPAIDWNAVFSIPIEEPKVIDLGLEVKAETEEERERLWNLIQQASKN